mmetsp:Transcript_45013/g.71930  ORF Transcript_45013/g.71930 Transcript_45013/m.71930 type:complete len:117 (-) Transcript_45013:1908-2258(-)
MPASRSLFMHRRRSRCCFNARRIHRKVKANQTLKSNQDVPFLIGMTLVKCRMKPCRKKILTIIHLKVVDDDWRTQKCIFAPVSFSETSHNLKAKSLLVVNAAGVDCFISSKYWPPF